MGVRGGILHDKVSLIQVNRILRIRSISHCVDISYVFLYLKFKHFISIDAVKAVNLSITFTHS